MSGVSSVVIKIAANTAQAVTEIGKVNKAVGETQTTSQKMHSAVAAAAIPAAAALTALAGAAALSAKAAAEDQKSREQLDSQMERSTGATHTQIKAVEDWIDAQARATGVSEEQLRPALAALVRTTGDQAEAQSLLNTAMDTAAATGKPLQSVTEAIGKAYEGQNGALVRLVPSLEAVVHSGGSTADVMQELNRQVHGAAAGEADTAAGQYARLQVSIHELEVSIGDALLPALQAVLPVLTEVFAVAGGHTDLIVGLGVAIASVAGVVVALNAAFKVYDTIGRLVSAVTDLMTTSLGENRIALVLSRIATIATTVAEKAAALASRAWAAAQIALDVALEANPIALVVTAIAGLVVGLIEAYRHSATFRSIVQSAFEAVAGAARTVVGAVEAIVSWFGRVVSASSIARQVVAVFDAIASAIERAIGAVSSLVGKLSGIHIPHIPGLNLAAAPAVGGYGAGVSSYATGAGAAGGFGGGVFINVSGAIDPDTTAIAIRRALERYDRRRGRAFRDPSGGGQ